MNDYAEKASNYVITHARFYNQPLRDLPSYYGVSYRGRAIVSSDIGELVQKLQARMEAEVGGR